MNARSIVSPDDQKVTFVELFFDLVFVFSVTQIVSLLHHGMNATALGQTILVFWLVWWGWTQFTWALNAADTTHHLVELATLLATAVAFFMAVAVPDAFAGGALRFALPYVLVRVLGLMVYGWVAEAANAAQHAAVRRFCYFSSAGLAAVLIGAVIGGTPQYWIWGLAILLDIIAAAVGGADENWNLHPDHFAERHALFIIIALGETLIVAATGVTGAQWTPQRITVVILAVANTCALWWSYFTRAKPVLDHALASARGAQQSTLARDVFSLLHFPMLCGVIAYAAAIEEAVAHADRPFSAAARLALAAGLALFLGAMTIAIWRARRQLLRARLALALATALAILVLPRMAPATMLAIAFAGLAAMCIWEQVFASFGPAPQQPAPASARAAPEHRVHSH
jgi:low temperature requirement protein LtrA